MKKLDQLTFTRFLAAFMVVFFHSGHVFPGNTFPFNPLFTSGLTAVSYFFVLSGFVMAIVYYRPGERFEFGTFWKARFSRIYPVYILAFVLTCLFYIDIMGSVKTNKILANLFLVQAWFPRYAQSFNIAAWTLSVEAFFYLIFPFLAILAYRLPARKLIWISVVFWAISQIMHVGLTKGWFMQVSPSLLAYSPLVHLNTFLVGMAGGVWYLTEAARNGADHKTSRWWLLLGLGLVGAALIGRLRNPVFSVSFSLDAGLLAPFFLVIILALAVDKTSLSRRLSHPRLILLGDASYAIYILHLPIRWIGERWAAEVGLAYPIFLYGYWFFVVGLSIFVFLRIERPARDWLRINFSQLLLIILDIIIILSAVYLSYIMRLGGADALQGYGEAFRFMARLALTAYLIGFIAWRLYDPALKSARPASLLRPILAATLFGAVIVTGGMFMAVDEKWFEGFSRATILISALLTGGMAFGIRAALPYFSRKPAA